MCSEGLQRSSFLVKILAKACSFINERNWFSCYHWSFAKFLRTAKSATRVVLKKSCSQKFRNAHRRTPVLESLSNFIKKRLQHRCFPVSVAKHLIWRSSPSSYFWKSCMLWNRCKWLILERNIYNLQKSDIEKIWKVQKF